MEAMGTRPLPVPRAAVSIPRDPSSRFLSCPKTQQGCPSVRSGLERGPRPRPLSPQTPPSGNLGPSEPQPARGALGGLPRAALARAPGDWAAAQVSSTRGLCPVRMEVPSG